LRGAGPSATVIAAPSTVTTFGLNLLNGLPIAALVLVGHGAHVSISGLEVRGPLPCAPVNGVLVIHGATLNLSDARVDDIEPATPDCGVPPSGRAVVYGLPPFIVVDGQHGSNAFGRVSNVVVDDYLTEGLTATGAFTGVPTYVTFADNVVNPGSPPIAADQFGINIRYGATATIAGNTVTGAVCTFGVCGADPILEAQSGGILVASAAPGTTIAANHVTNADIGVYQLSSPGCCRISDNVLSDNRYFGIVIQDGNGSTDSNTITGGQTGIGVVADAVDTTGVLRGDIITGTSLAPVRELQCCGFTATAIVSP
jgi:parallel beta-helix repeat protein